MEKKNLLMGLLALTMLAGCSSGTADSGSSDSGDAEPKQEEQTVSKAAVSVGETADANGVKITVTSADTNPGTEFLTPDDGNTFLICHVKVENATDDKLDINPYDFKLDVNGVEQDTDLMGSSLDGVNELNMATLKKGASIEGDLAFQIPADDSGDVTLEYYANSFFDDEPAITVKI